MSKSKSHFPLYLPDFGSSSLVGQSHVYVDKDHGFNIRIALADVRRIALIVGLKHTFDDEVAVHLELVPSGVRVCVFMRYSDVSAFKIATPLEVLAESSTCT